MLGGYYMREKQWKRAGDAFTRARLRSRDTARYALLAAYCALKDNRRRGAFDNKPVLYEVMKRLDHKSVLFALVRLYYDMQGDSNTLRVVEAAKTRDKALGYFYLALYYDATGATAAADAANASFAALRQEDTLEWGIYETMRGD
jgi:uncharacterized protein HemY